MNITVSGIDYWAPSNGGYIRRITDNRPGTLGQQITINGNAVEWDGLSDESLRKTIYRYHRHLCGREYKNIREYMSEVEEIKSYM